MHTDISTQTPPQSPARSPEQLPGATKTLIGMGACYALGTFTDNFYKQAAILLAATASMQGMQSVATVLFSLPFILFSAWAGALADRVSKKHIVVGVKTLELLALAIGGYMLMRENWYGMIAVMFCMGTQSTFFSPAINGSIPENFPPALVPRANSLIKLASTAAILLGMALAGFVLDMRETSLGGILPGFGLTGEGYGKLMAAFVVCGVALLGLGTAFAIKTRPASMPRENRPPFPWSGPMDSVKHALDCRKDPSLALVLLADAWFFGIAAIAVISIANLGNDLGYSKSISGGMAAVLMVGVAAGSLIAGRFSAESWKKLLVPAASGMAFMLLLVAATPLFPHDGFVNWQLCWFGASLFLVGAFGGLYLIPLESFIQVRPEPHMKGRVIAVSNFLSFVAMALFGALFTVIALLPSALTFLVYGFATLAFVALVAIPRLGKLPAASLRERAQNFLGAALKFLLSFRYRVTEEWLGEWQEEDQNAIAAPEADGKTPGVLILPNHPALIDPVIVYSRLAGLMPRPLSDEAQMSGLVQRTAAKIIRAVTIPDMHKAGRGGAKEVQRGLDNIVKALKDGDNVLLYPSGQLYRSSKEALGGKGAVTHILASVPGVRVLLVRTSGLWGSRFSYAYGKAPQFMNVLLRGIAAVFGNLFLFTPKRPVRIVFSEPADLPELVLAARAGDKGSVNRALEAFYNEAETPPVFIPRLFWQKQESALPGKEAKTKAATSTTVTAAASLAIPEDVREAVYAILRERANLGGDTPVSPEQNLATDLFLDSLSLMETVMALEERFGHAVPGPELLTTVEDCLLAAMGKLESAEEAVSNARPGDAPAEWFSADTAENAHVPLILAEGDNFAATFLNLAKKEPNAAFAAERAGLKTRKAMLTGVIALANRLEKLPGDRLGIMLPAVPAAVVIWLAAIYAGKEPVLINWTVGRRNMEHCLSLAKVSHIVTASALLNQLARTGVDLDGLPAELLPAETIGKSLSLAEKLRAALLAFLHCSPLPFSLKADKVAKTAAILFTSGSEAAPKAVPLTHTNIMTNAADVLAVLTVKGGDKLLAMLPPFHSFGLLAGLALPASSGIRTVYHANPTESGALVGLIRDYKATLLGATPTFMEGMLAKARGTDDLAPLQYAFVGAEKCPDHVYKAFAAQCPGASLCEGYGITECSPVVAVNRPGNAVPGTIGRALPSVTARIVIESETGPMRRAETGETGMLLVRGNSIFSGYLAPEYSAEGGEPPSNPFVEFEGEKWYRTGDLLCMDETGRLTFKGRLKRFVKIGGEMISLPQMEDVLQAAFASRPDLPPDSLNDGKPFIAVEAKKGSEDQGAAELIAFTTLPLSVETVNRALRGGGLSSVYSVRKVVKLEAIPVLGTGKTDYRALKNMTI